MEDKFKVSDQVRVAYEKGYTKDVIPWRDAGAFYKARRILTLVERNDVRAANVLEVGFGEGSILKHLSESPTIERLTGLEISDAGIRIAKERQIDKVVHLGKFDGYAIDFPDKAFDLVVLSHVLEHVEHERVLLREIKRVSSFACIEVPLDYSEAVDQKYKHFLSYGHVNIYTPPLLRFLLKVEGFEILDDIAEISGDKVREYQRYVLQRVEEAPKEREAFRSVLRERRAKFDAQTKAVKERTGNEYAVLCRCLETGLRVFEKPPDAPEPAITQIRQANPR